MTSPRLRVRCITFNLKGLGDGWFEARRPAFLAAARALEPDLLLLQEVLVRHESPLYHQARELGQALGLPHVAFSPYGNPDEILANRDQGGVAIVSRWALSDVRGRRLPAGHLGASDARTALFACVDAPAGSFGVLTTHLSWRAEESEIRLLQLGLLLEELDRLPWGPGVTRQLLAGDLNATTQEPCLRAALAQLTDAFARVHPAEEGHTWSKRNPLTAWENLPDRRIDYVLCDRSAAVLECHVVFDEPAGALVSGLPFEFAREFTSDHFGVWAELEWAPEQPES